MQTQSKISFLSAYVATSYVAYFADGPWVLRVGQHHPLLDERLSARGCTSWCFVTAWNPGSCPLSRKENDKRQTQLQDCLSQRGFFTVPGQGVADAGNWEPEESVLVLGIAREEALALASRFGQNALLFGVLGGEAELLWCEGRSDLAHSA